MFDSSIVQVMIIVLLLLSFHVGHTVSFSHTVLNFILFFKKEIKYNLDTQNFTYSPEALERYDSA